MKMKRTTEFGSYNKVSRVFKSKPALEEAKFWKAVDKAQAEGIEAVRAFQNNIRRAQILAELDGKFTGNVW